MIPFDIDPSLHTAEPEPPLLGDGFSPPRHGDPAATAETPPADDELDPPLPGTSPSPPWQPIL